jgi:hypothetical protein
VLYDKLKQLASKGDPLAATFKSGQHLTRIEVQLKGRGVPFKKIRHLHRYADVDLLGGLHLRKLKRLRDDAKPLHLLAADRLRRLIYKYGIQAVKKRFSSSQWAYIEKTLFRVLEGEEIPDLRLRLKRSINDWLENRIRRPRLPNAKWLRRIEMLAELISIHTSMLFRSPPSFSFPARLVEEQVAKFALERGMVGAASMGYSRFWEQQEFQGGGLYVGNSRNSSNSPFCNIVFTEHVKHTAGRKVFWLYVLIGKLEQFRLRRAESRWERVSEANLGQLFAQAFEGCRNAWQSAPRSGGGSAYERSGSCALLGHDRKNAVLKDLAEGDSVCQNRPQCAFLREGPWGFDRTVAG